MPAPAPLITPSTVAPVPAGSRSTPVGADVQQSRASSPSPRSTQPVVTPSGSGSTPAGVDVRHVQVPAPSIARIPAGPAIRLGNTKAANDPRFTKVMGKLEQSAAKSREHPPATQKSVEAQAASVPPANEKLTGAESNKVDTMHDAPTKQPDSESFLTLLRAEIAKVMPKNLGETDKFMKGGKKEQLKQAATSNVNQQRDAATAGMQSASKAPPDTSRIQGKQVVPLRPGGPSPVPPAIGAADAVPTPKSDAEVSQQKSKDEANNRLTSAHVTPEQLKKANDPRFSAVLSAKAAVDKHADAAPKNYRADEHKTLTRAAAQAVGEEKKGLGAFHGQGSLAAAHVQGKQLTAKAKDEVARKQVTDHIQSIYDTTRQTVDNKLSTLEKEVGDLFDKGVNTALANMTSYIDDRMGKWKFQRYLSNLMGPFLWVRDQFLPLPDEVNVFYTEGRQRFTQELDRLIVQIATLVDTRLKEAKDEIANGQKKISDYVKGLPANLQAVGKAAEQDIASRFDEMRQAVDDKKNELAQSLAQKYKDASDKADAKIKEMQDQNKGLLSTLMDKLGTVVKILTEFRDRIMGMLRQGKAAIDLIVADPIGFLRNLLNALKQGLMQFIRNIWNHLKVGFMKWLLGSLASAGVIVPSDFSLASILQLVLQVLGLTYDRIRAKAVKYIGERNVEILEKALQMLSTLFKAGPAALWEQIKENLSNLKEMVIDSLQSWLVTTVIQAAVIKLASMFTPVGAIIQAIITIYNTVTFFIERINQILDFVQAIFNSVLNIARGNIAGAANWIEQALARSLPVIISFLAALIGVTGITAKIRSIIQKVQNKIDAALDKLIQKIVNTVKKLLGKVLSGVKKLFGKLIAGGKKLIGKAIAGGKKLLAKGKQAIGQAADWWKARKQFKTRSGEIHTLFFSGKDEHAVLMMASPTPHVALENYIKSEEYLTGTDPAHPKVKDTAAKQKAKAAALSIIAAIRIRSGGDPTGRSDDIKDLLNNLAPHMAILAESDVKIIPPSVIKYGSVNSEQGATWMRAEILSKYHTDGSDVDTDGEAAMIWVGVVRRLYPSGKRPYYVQGHLLNNKYLGGLGKPYNLTPITRSANGNHSSRAEQKIRRLVEKDIVVRYFVTVEYGTHSPRSFRKTLQLQIENAKKEIKALQEKIDRGTDTPVRQQKYKDDKAKKEKEKKLFTAKAVLMDYEQQNLATAFVIEFAVLKLDDSAGKWVDDAEATKKTDVKTDPLKSELPEGDFLYDED